jgi:uncharacterized protein (TIGR02678 family)
MDADRGSVLSGTPADPAVARSKLRRPAPLLREQVETAARDERRRALLALLRRPLLTADDPDAADFALVRRHQAWLVEWLAHHAGWSLVVTAEVARLHKIPGSNADDSRGALDPTSDAPFSRRRYVLFCLALAVLERGDRQTTLGHLARNVTALLAAEPLFAGVGLTFDLTALDERRDFVAVLRLLLRLGVLRRVQGHEERYVRDDSTDVLYDVVRAALAALLSARRSPSLVAADDFEDRLAALVAEPLPDTADGRNRRIRIRLARMLLDDPVVYYADLTDDERAYFEKQRPFLMRDLADDTGLEREERAEGAALVDTTGEATDIGLPEEGTEGHLTLLLATWLADRRRAMPEVEIGYDTWHAQTAAFIAEHRHHWRRDVTRPGADAVVADDVATRLEGLGLVRRTARGLAPRPAIGRYALREP